MSKAWMRAVFAGGIVVATVLGTSAQTFTTLVNFAGPNGEEPDYVSLIQGTDGRLYGTTSRGGYHKQGTIFRMTESGQLTYYSFCASAGCADGAAPVAGAILATDGSLYGTTCGGGTSGYGTVFKITSQGTLITLHSFDNGDGACPYAALVQGSNGNFYGTTSAGGTASGCSGGCGTVFEITEVGKLTTLHNFGSTDGAFPVGSLIQATDEAFYGTTEYGGMGNCSNPITNGCGTTFRITSAGAFTTLYTFCLQSGCADGSSPTAGLVEALDGNLYGTTETGGDFNCGASEGCGTVFTMTAGGVLKTLQNLCSQPNCSDGYFPGGLIQATDGNFYGTTNEGGASKFWGTIFEVTPTGILTTLHSFQLSDGADPVGAVLQATDGNFYGTTPTGGNAG